MAAQSFTMAILDEINLVRQNPQGYIPYLEEFLGRFIEDTLYIKSDGKKCRVKEGKTVVYECINYLSHTSPLVKVFPCAELEEAALDHANDSELNNLIGHIGSDGSTTAERISRYGTWKKKIGENIRYANSEARDIVIGMLVDDGVPARGHRLNLLNPDFGFVGSALGGHEKYRYCCVLVFANSFA